VNISRILPSFEVINRIRVYVQRVVDHSTWPRRVAFNYQGFPDLETSPRLFLSSVSHPILIHHIGYCNSHIYILLVCLLSSQGWVGGICQRGCNWMKLYNRFCTVYLPPSYIWLSILWLVKCLIWNFVLMTDGVASAKWAKIANLYGSKTVHSW